MAVGFAAGRFSSPAPAPPTATAAVGSLRERAPTGSSQKTPPESLPKTGAAPDTESDDVRDWETRWAQLAAQPHSPATDEAAAAALARLAARDPQRALALALAERDRRRRAVWLHAVLRGWAATAPEAAMVWVTGRPADEREDEEAAVMEGAAHDPAAALALAQGLVQNDPARARSHANQLLRVLDRRGDYDTAVAFASGLPEDIRAEMVGTAFQYWARSQPQHALTAAINLPAGDTREATFDAAVTGWAGGDPAGLAQAALQFPSAADRTHALETALRAWVALDPKAASDWIDQFDPEPEFDGGAAAVALQPDVLAVRPDVAASWAESIVDPVLRSSTLANVLREWADRDAPAALKYARASTALEPADSVSLLADLGAKTAVPSGGTPPAASSPLR